MISFREALSAPKLHFKRLGQTKSFHYDHKNLINSTSSTFETEIDWNGRHYMLYTTWKRERIEHIEHLEEISQERSRGPLIENRILYDELMVIDSLGNKCYYDIILQERPKGMMLKEAVLYYKIADLRQVINKMKSRLDAIGFNHRNLTPSNILICDSGVARPLRYWYAEWEVFSNNDISQLEDFLDRYDSPECDLTKAPLLIKEHEEEEGGNIEPKECEGITRRYKCGRYGFVDCDGKQITKYQYIWASDFREGRAIVSRNNKFGVINNQGKCVIPTIYKSIDFDINTGLFHATMGNTKYTIDYNGTTIHHEKFEGGGFVVAENCSQK
jgi:hypothetical protein